ncbi:MAG: Arc family DNA-binding protein [Rhizobiaceae bacterium]|nr:Arc family DNA-binding protein [Rhizobiaceae bacterium]MCV0408910.1 Arc family DNA-binding protein [Rhizobiaceae bacterium]
MPPPRSISFHLRMPKRLKDDLQIATDRGGKSLNTEIVRRLERSFGPDDDISQLAEILKPFMDDLNEEDRATLIAAARILAKNRRKARRKS